VADPFQSCIQTNGSRMANGGQRWCKSKLDRLSLNGGHVRESCTRLARQLQEMQAGV
jgi:hypothetical protein